jgi:hypothetical protein
LLDPQQLLAGERAVLAGTPDENELIAGQLKRLNAAIDAKQGERARLIDAYQASLLNLDELTRRTSALTARHSQLVHERDTLTTRSAELTSQNRLRHRLAYFSERIAASLDELDFEGRQRLLRLVVERVHVSGWRVEIHLKIPLPDEPRDDDPPEGGPSGPDQAQPGPASPARPRPLSSDVRLRSVHAQRMGWQDTPNDDQEQPAARDRRPPRRRGAHHEG